MRIDRIKLSTELMKRDMTQAELAGAAGISRGTINNIVGGKRCRDEIGVKIADALNVPIEKLLEN